MIGPATTSDEKSSSAQIITRLSFLHGFELLPPAVGYATLKIYDSNNSSTSGKLILTEGSCAAGQNSLYLAFHTPRVANQGIHCILTGTTTYTVAWSPG